MLENIGESSYNQKSYFKQNVVMFSSNKILFIHRVLHFLFLLNILNKTASRISLTMTITKATFGF